VDTTVSPQVRLIALIGLIAALGLGGWMFLMRGQTDASAGTPLPPPAVIKPKPAATVKPATAAAKPATPVKKAAAVPAKPAVAAKPKPVAKPKLVVKAKPKPKPSLIAPNGLPTAVVEQLARYGVVVAAVYANGAAVDTLARDEAQAGAGDARVGFAALDVSDKRIAKALATKTEILTAPAVLVFGKDGEVRARFDGFADRILVAELAAPAG
jgi:hypothetical protein